MSFTAIELQESKPRIAVNVHNVYFRYTKNALILERMNLKILEGKIFGLLGSNGSGKTTLLRLILGRLKPQSGSVSVFGLRPGSKHSNVPGTGVGYMPQETAVYPEFTINETLTYYGIINHMNGNDIQKRIKLLSDLLNIPDNDRPMTKLSGGQQRLVSIAVTMIHNPQLLILDEPTVGVDSLIRCRIWKYLEDICDNQGITVIVTTHYIEEARSAANIGFVNNGYLLAQSSPQQLQQQYRVKTLEEVYYKLTIVRRRSRRMSLFHPEQFHKDRDDLEVVKEENEKYSQNNSDGAADSPISVDRMYALFWRNVIQLKRNPLMFVFFYILMALIIALISIVFDQEFQQLPMAIYNGEQPPQLTQTFIENIDKRLLNVTLYERKDYAIDSVINGRNLLVLEFGQNFTDGFIERIEAPQLVSDEAVEESTVRLSVDMSNPIYTAFANIYLLKALRDFIRNYSLAQAYNPRAYDMPFTLETVFSDLKPNFKDVVAPGLILSIMHALSMVLTGFVFMFEKRNGCLERGFVNGIKPIEIIVVQMVWFTVALSVQTALAFGLSFYVFNFTLMGSGLMTYLLMLVQGIHGLVFGMACSLVIQNDYNVMMTMLLTTLPMFIASGILWPLEAMPIYAQWVCRFLPLTQSVDAMRSLMFRGWSVLNTQVMAGYAVNIIYIIVFFLTSLFMLKRIN